MGLLQRMAATIPLCAAVAGLDWGTAQAASFTYTTLDVPGQNISSIGPGNSLNDLDQVVGTTISSSGVYQGFSWSGGTFTLFATCNELNSVNASGLALGYNTTSFSQYCTVATGSGVTTTYPVRTGHNLSLDGINASGMVLGQTHFGRDKTEGLLLVKSKTTVVSVPGSEVKYGGTFPAGLNDGGTVVGSYSPPGATWNQGFLYAQGQYTTFSVPGGIGTYPLFITADGTLGGKYLLNVPGETSVGFVTTGSTTTMINPPGATQSYVVGIGPNGEAAGSFVDSSTNHVTHGFLYQGGAYYQIDVPGASYTYLYHVNANGTLAGMYDDRQGNQHPFIAQCAAGQTCTQ